MGAAQTVFSAEDIYFLEKHSIMDRAQVEVGRAAEDVSTLSRLFKDEKCQSPQEWYNNFKEVNPSGEVSRDTYRKLYSEKLFGEIG